MDEIPQTIGVLIATYQRPTELVRCLTALGKQTLVPNDVLVVVREDDTETIARLNNFAMQPLPFRIITVSRPGTVAARNAGLDACKTDILALIDDDTSPHADWLGRVMEDFRNDPSLGGLGREGPLL